MNTRVINNLSCHILSFFKFTNWLFTECPLCPSHFLWSIFLSVWLMFKYIYKERIYFDKKVYLIVMNHLSKYSNLLSIGSYSGENRQIPGSTGCCGIIPVKWYRKLKIEGPIPRPGVHQGPRRRVPVTINITSGPEFLNSENCYSKCKLEKAASCLQFSTVRPNVSHSRYFGNISGCWFFFCCC